MTAITNENTQHTDPDTGELLVNGFIYIGLNNLDAKLNPAIIYSDRDLTTPILNPQRTGEDGRSVNKIWVAGQYSMKVESSENVQKLNDLSLGSDFITGNSTLISVSGTNLIVATASSPASSLVNNQVYILTAANANTGAMTLTIDAFPTYPIKKHHDLDMDVGDVEARQTLAVIWNETDSIYELMTNSSIGPVNLAGNQTIAGTKTFSSPIIGDIVDGAKTNAANVFTQPQTFNGALPLVFEGATDDAFETTMAVEDPTTDNTLTLPDRTGTLALQGDILTIDNIQGLILSNDADTDHDVNITAGYALDSLKLNIINLPSEITKQIDATFAAGDDAGGMAPTTVETGTFTTVTTAVTGTGSLFLTEFTVGDVLYSSSNTEARRITAIASDLAMTLDSGFTVDVTVAENVQKNGLAPDTPYHMYLIEKVSDETVDVFYDVDATAANIPTGYTSYKWIWAVLTDASSNIKAFNHNANTPNYCQWDVVAPDLTTTDPGTDLLTTLSVPTGFKLSAHIAHTMENTNVGSQVNASVRDPDMTNGALTVYEYDHHRLADISGYGRGSSNRIRTMTNSSGQIRTRSSFSNANVSLHIGTVGWEVDRKTV